MTDTTSKVLVPVPTLNPLVARLSPIGIVEHSIGAIPEPSLGHCVDDAGRALGMAAFLPDDPNAERLALACMHQLLRSRTTVGTLSLRLDEKGEQTDDPPSDDATSRAVWGLALVSTRFGSRAIRKIAAQQLDGLRRFRSPYPRAAAQAVLAACVLLDASPSSLVGIELLANNLGAVPRRSQDGKWFWPEDRLSYGNAILPEALLAAGQVLREPALVSDGLRQLAWLIEIERPNYGHFSFTPIGGRGPGEPGGFDQQPLEAWAMASACARAHAFDADPLWSESALRAARWFAGDNDTGDVMWDTETGASFDALTAKGPNRNQGAESSLSLIGTVLAATSATEGRLAAT